MFDENLPKNGNLEDSLSRKENFAARLLEKNGSNEDEMT